MYRPSSTLEQWRILQAVVDYGGYAQAAQALNKSQSSLNHAVAKLQQVLGVPLLEVKGRKAHLTKQGQVLLRRSRNLTSEIEHLETLAANLEQEWEAEIKLSREILYPTEALYQALSQFYPQSRGTRIVMVDNVISGSSDAIHGGNFDLAITGIVPAGFSGIALGTVQMILVCHPQHPLTREPLLDQNRLAQELQIVIRDTGSLADQDMGWLKAEQRWTFSNFYEAIAILRKGVGFCWIPQHLATTEIDAGNLVELKQVDASGPTVPVSLVVPQPEKLGAAAQAFAKILVACAPNNTVF
ncbi:LysR family transcriptional regulator [Ferrimonas lipolytica]|uniref:LysR family transcriptional regulator n=1 Tax=Ferrimonas lipolytica TaxID=2724191 RepID=A0A6H1UDY7_9GAMM|nr:LysR family transcriptional regulator [Ferrimonas lipolytica]QIZ76436.1 LysR family transcriptional regulator [Ferrimonas lipolytica]